VNKPQPKPRYTIDYSEAKSWISYVLGYNLRDTLESHLHFDRWCREKGEEPDGHSQEQYARYLQDPEGEAACPEYRDFWHFLCDHQDMVGGEFRICSDLLESAEEWQAEIVNAFIREFGDDAVYRKD
jgi:hypothetical protein